MVSWDSLHRSSAIARQPRLDVHGIAQHVIQRATIASHAASVSRATSVTCKLCVSCPPVSG